jgi:hypothetical protein
LLQACSCSQGGCCARCACADLARVHLCAWAGQGEASATLCPCRSAVLRVLDGGGLLPDLPLQPNSKRRRTEQTWGGRTREQQERSSENGKAVGQAPHTQGSVPLSVSFSLRVWGVSALLFPLPGVARALAVSRGERGRGLRTEGRRGAAQNHPNRKGRARGRGGEGRQEGQRCGCAGEWVPFASCCGGWPALLSAALCPVLLPLCFCKGGRPSLAQRANRLAHCPPLRAFSEPNRDF